jgi:hypothetical protein
LGQLIPATVQLPIRHGVLASGDGNPIGRSRYLGFKYFGEGTIDR